MDKLDIHEFLRIYLPGIFITFMAGRMLYGSNLDNANIAIVAIFIGLSFSWFATRLSQKFFLSVANEKHFDHAPEKSDYWSNWIHLVRKRSKRSKLTRKDVEAISFAHYAHHYSSPDLYSFRLPKTFGVLYFNIAVSAGLLLLIPISHLTIGHPVTYHSISFGTISDALILAAVMLVFLIISKDYFVRSLKMELFYWVNPPANVEFD